jgi:hypothetical protein
MKYCIFVEMIFNDEKFRLLKDFVVKKIDGYPILDTERVHLFVTTPANYYLAVAEQGYSGTKEQYEKIILERYKQLELLGVRLHLHLHLAMIPESINQEKMFKEAVGWMKDNGFEPKMVTFGWYIYNEESLRLAKKYGLEFFNDSKVYSIHDYEFPNIYKPILILQNIRGMVR